MNELINTNLTISSREIAKLTGKRHDHVIRDIEAISEELGQTPNLGADYNISKSTYQSGTGKRRSCGAPVRQFKWYSSVINELEALEVAL